MTFLWLTLLISLPHLPAKERVLFNVSSEDAKFDNPWRREGPLPTRDSFRRSYDAPGERPARLADDTGDWRSNRPNRAVESEALSFKRKGSGFNPPEGQFGAADKEDSWSTGNKFRPSSDAPHDEALGKFGSIRGKGDMGPPKEIPRDEPDWRTSVRSRPGRDSISRKITFQPCL